MGDKFSISRRRLLQAGAALGGAMLLPGVMQAALGRRLGQTGANPRAGRIYSADRLRAAGHRRGEGV